MNPKALNALAARVARLETLMENSDVFKAEGDTTYGGLQFEGSEFNFDGQSAEMFELQQRINDLELLVANGSRDVAQGGALDAGASVGDDGSDGTGSAGGVPAGFTEVPITLCIDGVSTPATILARI